MTDITFPEPPVETCGVQFAEVAHERGLLHVWPRQPRPMTLRETFGCGCATFDYNNDGLQDVLLVADPHPVLFRNTGGSFENVTAASGLKAIRAHGVTASPRPPGSVDEAGVGHRGRARDRRGTRSAQWADWTGVAVGDYDGDGWLDVLLTGFHRLALFKNNGGETFIDVTRHAGLDPANHGHWSSSAGFMDLDGDSRLDLVVLNYLSSSDPRIHFGLGKLASLDTVTIRWPSGRVDELHDVPADKIVHVVEGQGTVDERQGRLVTVGRAI